MNIIITGAGKGIGYELVKTLCKHKQNHVLAISRKMSELNDESPRKKYFWERKKNKSPL